MKQFILRKEALRLIQIKNGKPYLTLGDAEQEGCCVKIEIENFTFKHQKLNKEITFKEYIENKDIEKYDLDVSLEYTQGKLIKADFGKVGILDVLYPYKGVPYIGSYRSYLRINNKIKILRCGFGWRNKFKKKRYYEHLIKAYPNAFVEIGYLTGETYYIHYTDKDKVIIPEIYLRIYLRRHPYLKKELEYLRLPFPKKKFPKKK